MKLENMVGKPCVRLARRVHSDDRSYMSEPIVIDSVVNGVIYYRSNYSDKLLILPADYNDDQWVEVVSGVVDEKLKRYVKAGTQ